MTQQKWTTKPNTKHNTSCATTINHTQATVQLRNNLYVTSIRSYETMVAMEQAT